MSNIDSYPIGMNMSEEDKEDKEDEYLENMIIRFMYEIANYNNESLKDEVTYAKVNALSIYLQAALKQIAVRRNINTYQKLIDRIPLDTTAKGIVNTAFVQEKALQKKLVKDDEHGM